MYQAVLTYDQRLIRRAVFSFWRRSVGIDFTVALLLLAGSLAVLLAVGDRSWLVGALGTVLVMGIVFAGAVYVIHSTNAFRKLQEMGSPTASFQAEEASFTVTSAIGTCRVPDDCIDNRSRRLLESRQFMEDVMTTIRRRD